MKVGTLLDSWFRLDGPHVADLEIGEAVRVIARPSQDCGCPEEEWLFSGLPLLIHFEPDGAGEAVLELDEDVSLERAFTGVAQIEDLRAEAFAWARACLGGKISGGRL